MCYVQILEGSEDREKIRVVATALKMETKRELTKFFVVKDSPTLLYINPYEIRMKIVFKRRLTSETMKAFFPSLILLCCSYSTSFFRLPNFFNTAITANLTLLLTMTTLMIGVMTRIPETSYIKWIEFWLLFGIFVIFLQVILITIIEWLRHKEEIEQKKETEKRKEGGLDRSAEPVEMSIGSKIVKVSDIPFCKETALAFT